MDEFQIDGTYTNVTYIYALLDPDTKQARYVGQSGNAVQRFKEHLWSSARTCATRSAQGKPVAAKDEWITKLLESGKEPLLAILQEVRRRTGEVGPNSTTIEQRWIMKLVHEGHPLLNSQVLRSYRSNERMFQDARALGRELFDTDL